MEVNGVYRIFFLGDLLNVYVVHFGLLHVKRKRKGNGHIRYMNETLVV